MNTKLVIILLIIFISGISYGATDSLWVVGAGGYPGDLVTVEVWLQYEGGGITDSMSEFDILLTWDAAVCSVESYTLGQEFVDAMWADYSRIDNQGTMGPPAVPKIGLTGLITMPAFVLIPRGTHLAATLDFRILDTATPGDSTCIDTLMEGFSPPIYLGYVDKGGIHTYTPSFSTECVRVHGIELEIPLDEGWNLISYYVNPSVCSVAVVLEPMEGNYIIVRGFDQHGIEHGQRNNGALTYNPALPPAFNDLVYLYPGYGYWIKLAVDDTLPVEGFRVPPETPLALDENWNLRGYLPEVEDSVAHALSSIDGNYIIVRGFDQHGLAHCQRNNGALTYNPALPPAFNDLVFLWPGFGYWIKLSVDDTLVYPEPMGGCNGGQLAPSGSKGEDVVIPTPLWVDFWGEATLDGSPVKVGDIVTVYDPDGVKCGEFVVRMEGAYGILHVYGDDETTPDIDEGAEPGDALAFWINGNAAKVLKGENPVWSHDSEVRHINLVTTTCSERVELPPPKVFSLSKVYPNPFKGTIAIQYQLPRSGYMTLRIYNVAGELVKTLVAEEKQQGYHTIHWDGRDSRGQEVVPGVYFCRFEVEGFTQTRKVALMR